MPPAHLHFDAPIVCFSHLRWDFVFQRPQHLLSRLAQQQPVLYVEEPVPTDGEPCMELRTVAPRVQVAVPRLPHSECGPANPLGEERLRGLLNGLLMQLRIERPVLWYYTPMMLGFTDHLQASAIVYDCMDELTGFMHAPAELVPREKALMARADLVFTGGHSLYQAKRRAHRRVHAFPSSVDARHFAQARTVTEDPADMAGIAQPRIGFYGVVDERLDIALLGAAAEMRPDWQWLVIGPVVKIDPATLPQRPNIHYLGSKRYEELPRYLGRWDVAMMPFALNASTRFISPTKTPEYLAGGCPVVSTPITDVVNGYGASGLVRIGDGAAKFVEAIEATLASLPARSPAFCQRADALLRDMSWDSTVAEMRKLITERIAVRMPAQDRTRRIRAGLPATEAAWTASV